jgi:hypothetical protein
MEDLFGIWGNSVCPGDWMCQKYEIAKGSKCPTQGVRVYRQPTLTVHIRHGEYIWKYAETNTEV